jgi:hypothetical protein
MGRGLSQMRRIGANQKTVKNPRVAQALTKSELDDLVAILTTNLD